MNRFKFHINISVFTIFLGLLVLSCLCPFSHNIWAQYQEEDVIYFDSDTNSIDEESKQILNRRAELLKDGGEYIITLEGYSDITGKADYNLELSKKRAQLVKDYLIDLGIESSSIEVVGKGGTEKYGSGETNEALEQNRRVNLIVEIAFVPAIELETPEPEVQAQEEVEPTEEPQVTKEPEVTQEPEITPEPEADDSSEESYEAETTPEPVKTISEETSSRIETLIRKHASDGITFIAPGAMQIGQRYKVEAQISSTFVEAISKDLKDLWFEKKIGLSLIGNTFDITSESQNQSDLKSLDENTATDWKWEVVAKRGGINSLILAVVINVNEADNKVALGEFATFQRVVDVEPSIIHSITSSYWIMGILILLIVGIVFWILNQKVRLN